MTIRPVYEEPEVELFAWSFMREDGLIRLVGYRTDDRRGHITSSLADVDMAARGDDFVRARVSAVRRRGAGRGIHILVLHARRWGLDRDSVALVDADEVVLIYAPHLGPERWN